jgi:hypothetical protein
MTMLRSTSTKRRPGLGSSRVMSEIAARMI